MKCKVCSLIENKYKIFGCKWDTLTKHVGCKIVICDVPMLVLKKGGDGCNLEIRLQPFFTPSTVVTNHGYVSLHM